MCCIHFIVWCMCAFWWQYKFAMHPIHRRHSQCLWLCFVSNLIWSYYLRCKACTQVLQPQKVKLDKRCGGNVKEPPDTKRYRFSPAITVSFVSMYTASSFNIVFLATPFFACAFHKLNNFSIIWLITLGMYGRSGFFWNHIFHGTEKNVFLNVKSEKVKSRSILLKRVVWVRCRPNRYLNK